jgi:hypothetical protein
MSGSTIRKTAEDGGFRVETLEEQFWRKSKENPAVPIGMSHLITHFFHSFNDILCRFRSRGVFDAYGLPSNASRKES